VFSREVALPTPELPRYGYRALAFDEANHRGHCVLGWYLDAHMHVIDHQMAFNDPTFFLTSQLVKDGPKVFANLPKQCLAASFGNKYNVVLAIESGMRQALIGFRHRVLLWCVLIKPPWENSTAGTLKAFQVALVEPVAYLNSEL